MVKLNSGPEVENGGKTNGIQIGVIGRRKKKWGHYTKINASVHNQASQNGAA